MPSIVLRAALACALMMPACPLAMLASNAAAAETAAPEPSASPRSNDQDVSQRPLTELEIQNFIAAQKPIRAAIDELPEDKRDQPDAQSLATINKLASKFGFKDYGDFNEVGTNLEFVMQGFDPETKTFVGHEAVIKNQIAQVTAEKSMTAKDKSEALSELNELLNHVDPVKFSDNIKLVTKHYAELSEIFSG